MVDRISITTSRIVTRNSSNAVTFDTNDKYIKTVSSGAFKVGGLARGPCLVGFAVENNDQFFDYHQNKGFTTLLNRPATNLTPGTALALEFFVPSHNFSSSVYSASFSASNIGQLNLGGVRIPPASLSGATITNTAQTTSNVVFLNRRESPSDSWSFVTSGKVIYQSLQFTDGIFNVTTSAYLLDVDLLSPAVSARSTSYYYRLSLTSSWNNTMQAGGSSANYGTAEYRVVGPSVGRPPVELDLDVTL